MSCVLFDIAEAVKVFLNGTTFSQAFVAARDYLPEFPLEDMEANGLQVLVCPSAEEIDEFTREKNQYDVSIDVGVIKKLPTRTKADIDPLVQLVEEIQVSLHRVLTVGGETAGWVGSRCDPIYSRKHLREQGVFFSVTTIVFRIAR